MTSVRINKALASAGVCSRRKADELIAEGKVCVNGETVVELGLRVDPSKDSVTVNGKKISLVSDSSGQSHTYLALHKPIQVVSTASDPDGRQTVLDLLPEEFSSKRLYPVGRLDYFSEGLIFLTDDGEFTNRLTHPRYHLPKKYEVNLKEAPTAAMLGIMRKGMVLKEGERLAPVDVENGPLRNTLILTLYQGVNRQIRRMCRDLGLTILSLRRISIGPVQLGPLPKGKCRSLTEKELAALKKAMNK